MKVSFGFILLIVGVLGIARGAIDAPQHNLSQMIGTGPGIASLVTLAAAFLLVGGLLILARTGKFSFEGRGHTWKVAHNASLPLETIDGPRGNDKG